MWYNADMTDIREYVEKSRGEGEVMDVKDEICNHIAAADRALREGKSYEDQVPSLREATRHLLEANRLLLRLVFPKAGIPEGLEYDWAMEKLKLLIADEMSGYTVDAFVRYNLTLEQRIALRDWGPTKK